MKFPADVVPRKFSLDESATAFVAQFKSGAKAYQVPSFGPSALWGAYAFDFRGTESIILVPSSYSE